ncbi:MAG: hypothetical protein MEQ07_08830 [Aquimonas sp.]|nr:hypothetical protein [Aquimonas sp.]
MRRHALSFGLIAAALPAYYAGFMFPSVCLILAGIGLEVAFWARVLPEVLPADASAVEHSPR